MAGELVMAESARRGLPLLPIDSEHSAIFQALEAGRREDVARLILTASGGPFRTLPAAELERVTPEDALAHPNWSMGKKISIDSATLMNKPRRVKLSSIRICLRLPATRTTRANLTETVKPLKRVRM